MLCTILYVLYFVIKRFKLDVIPLLEMFAKEMLNMVFRSVLVIKSTFLH